jgi:DNA-binding winged helix-turn-helix (wHTH) protein
MATRTEAVYYEFGGLRLDRTERLLLRDGRVVQLTPKAFDLLVYLVEGPGKLVEKSALTSALWPDTIVEEANLAFQVSALRKVLDEGREGQSRSRRCPRRDTDSSRRSHAGRTARRFCKTDT